MKQSACSECISSEVSFAKAVTPLRLDVELEGVGWRDAEDLGSTLMSAGAAQSAEVFRVRQPSPDKRPADLVEVAGLAVTFAGTLFQVVEVIGDWLRRRRAAQDAEPVHSVTVVIDGDRVEVTYLPTAPESRRLKDFLKRHNDGEE